MSTRKLDLGRLRKGTIETTHPAYPCAVQTPAKHLHGCWMITLHAKMIEFCLCSFLWLCLWSLLQGHGTTQGLGFKIQSLGRGT